MCFACGILCNLYMYGTACEISVIYVFSITIQFKCFFRNRPSNCLNVPLNFDEWDRMSPLYPDLDRSLSLHATFNNTRGGPCQHGFMCGCRQWSNDINESNYNNMQPITIIQFTVRVGAYVRTNTDAPCMFILAMFGW